MNCPMLGKCRALMQLFELFYSRGPLCEHTRLFCMTSYKSIEACTKLEEPAAQFCIGSVSLFVCQRLLSSLHVHVVSYLGCGAEQF